MILSDSQIRVALAAGSIVISPEPRAEDIRPGGLRVHLHNRILVPAESDEEIDIDDLESVDFEEVDVGEDGFALHPHRLVLASTAQTVRTNRNLICMLDGRSSLARIGLAIHCSSSIVDNVHGGARSVVLEIVNHGNRPVRLRPGTAIGMLVFLQTRGALEQDPSPQYDQQIGPTRPSSGKSRRLRFIAGET